MILRKQQFNFGVSAAAFTLSLLMSGNVHALSTSEDHYALKLLGKFAFFDEISEPERQACVSCHEPATGGTNNDARVNQTVVAVPGANFHVSGGLKPPTNTYASLIPPFHECPLGGIAFPPGPPGTGTLYCGGNFWDGRAEGVEPPALFAGSTKHIGGEVFQGIPPGDPRLGYKVYFGATSDQALNPMPNPVEQNIQRQAVCEHVAASEYAELYKVAWGEPIDCSDSPVSVSAIDADVQPERKFDISFKRLMLAVGAWQASGEVNSFSSKRDTALRSEMACRDDLTTEEMAVVDSYYNHHFCQQLAAKKTDPASWGKFPLIGFTDQENYGHDLFYNTALPFPGAPPAPFPDLPVTNCSFCHQSDASRPDGTGLFELYSDTSYHNIGTPANPDVPADPQLGIVGHVDPTDTRGGFFRAPGLRNVDKRPNDRFIKAFGHNGWFKSLESIVHFYNTANVNGETAASFGISSVPCPPSITSERRALRAKCWPEPEWGGSVIGLLIGDMHMTAADEAAVVAYMKTLTDSVTAQPPQMTELYALIGNNSATTTQTATTTTITRTTRSRRR